MQETFHQVWRTAVNYSDYSAERSSVEVWLMLLARSRLLDFVRRRRPDATGSLVQTEAPAVDPLAELVACRSGAACQACPGKVARGTAIRDLAVVFHGFDASTNRRTAGHPAWHRQDEDLIGDPCLAQIARRVQAVSIVGRRDRSTSWRRAASPGAGTRPTRAFDGLRSAGWRT